MSDQKRIPIEPELLDLVNGGSFGYDPDSKGTFTMHCQYTGQTYYEVKLADAIEIARYGAYLEDNLENEVKTIDWAKQQGYIH